MTAGCMSQLVEAMREPQSQEEPAQRGKLVSAVAKPFSVRAGAELTAQPSGPASPPRSGAGR